MKGLSCTPVAKNLERVKGIEPSAHPWQGRVVPLNYTRNSSIIPALKISDNFFSVYTEFFREKIQYLYWTFQRKSSVRRVRVELTSEVFQTPAVTTLAISATDASTTVSLSLHFCLRSLSVNAEWARMESNHRLPSYKDGTLTAELLALIL